MNVQVKSEAQILFLLASYYNCYLITLIIVWGDYVQGLFQNKKLPCFSFLLSLVFSFATGMQSLRQTCIMVLPLLAFEGLRVLFLLYKQHDVDWRPTLRTEFITAANLGGVILIHMLHIPAVGYGETGMSFVPPKDWLLRLSYLFDAVKGITGLSYVTQYSGQRACFILSFSLLTIIVVLASLYRTAIRLYKGTAGVLEVLILLCVISLLAVCASTILLPVWPRSIYLFVWYFLICLSVLSLLNVHSKKVRLAATLLLCMISIANLPYSYAANVYVSLNHEKEAFPFYKEAADVLVDQGIEILYGSCTPASYVCAHTNGKIAASPWKEIFQPLTYIYPQDLCKPEDNQRAAYILFKSAFGNQLEDARQLAAEQGVDLVLIQYFDAAGGFGLYTASSQLMQPPKAP